ncbi:MAG: response regulator [Candidatus Kapaibacterium sp.]
MDKEKNNYSAAAFKITFIYLLLGLLFVVFMINSHKDTLSNIILGISFAVITSVVFYFLISLFLKKEIPPPVEKPINEVNYKEKYEEAKKAQAYSELMNNAKSQFLSNMSQEIRIPMSGIIGMTELMMLSNLTKEQKEYLDIINYSSSTLLAIINDILDFSRIESGKLKLEYIEFSINELLQKTAQILEFEAKRKNVALTVNIDPKINYNINGDPLRINQILINLAKNAIKYTDKGTVSLSLTEVKRTKNIASLCITVKDTGLGFDADTVKNLFGALDDSGKTIPEKNFRYSGFGFGVPIIKHLIALMDGEMFVKTNLNEGSEIAINLPFEITVKEVVDSQETVSPNVKKIEEPKVREKVNILVAEDNIVNQRLVKELLTRKNYDVTIVENGLKIFDVLEKSRFDLILMDIQMPIMDGLEATSIIREIEKGTGNHIPIIGITAYAVKADKEKCLSAGMDNYMSKPFVKEEFYKMIDSYVSEN